MRKIIMLMMSALIVLLSGCSPLDSEPTVGIDEGSTALNVHGVERTIYYRTPDMNATSLVIALHGGGDDVKSFEAYSKLTEEVKTLKTFGVIYPEGLNKHWNDGRTQSGSTAEDVLFIEEIISQYQNKGYKNFYVVGMSNGALMAQRLACEIPQKINGIVSVSSAQSTDLKANCTDNTPLTSMFIFGDSDPIFSSDRDTNGDFKIKLNRGTHIGMEATKEYWLNRNKCSSSIVYDKEFDRVDTDKTKVKFYNGSNCQAAFHFLDVVGGGHRWPDTSAKNGTVVVTLAGYATQEISTAKEIVNFFGL